MMRAMLLLFLSLVSFEQFANAQIWQRCSEAPVLSAGTRCLCADSCDRGISSIPTYITTTYAGQVVPPSSNKRELHHFFSFLSIVTIAIEFTQINTFHCSNFVHSRWAALAIRHAIPTLQIVQTATRAT